MTTPNPKPRWYHLTPDRLFTGLLAVQVFLFLSERFQWFPFNEHKGWTVLITVGVVGVAVVVMLVWGLVCLACRWRFQFSFRSLLVLLVAVSVPLGWFAWEMDKARRQRDAAEAIVKAGGRMHYLLNDNTVYMWDELPTPTWLRELLGDDFFYDVGFVSTNSMDDTLMVHVKELSQLKWLVVRDGSGISNDGLANLRGLTQLMELHLDGAQITDAGLMHLEGLTQLRALRLGGTKITDAAFIHLRRLDRLYYLFLRGSQVTDEGVKELQEALPNCEIIH